MIREAHKKRILPDRLLTLLPKHNLDETKIKKNTGQSRSYLNEYLKNMAVTIKLQPQMPNSYTQMLNLADQEKESINILQWNAEGVWGKKEALKHRLHEQKIDVACLQETHLKNSHRFSIRGYQTFRKDRESGPKGGILILVKNDLPAIELDSQETKQRYNVSKSKARKKSLYSIVTVPLGNNSTLIKWPYHQKDV